MSKYKHIFFDLDHTLWDFETNSVGALKQIFAEEKLLERGVESFEKFHYKYKPINDRYWARYHNGLVNKEAVRMHRFRDTLKEFGVEDLALANRMAESYVSLSPRMTALFPDAVEVLQYLQTKYKMHLITNGFAEVQWIKVEHSGLKPFFEHIIISEEVGTQKPSKEIFEIAIARACTNADECIMIGDNFNTDIVGAKNAGIDQVFFNPHKDRVREPVTYVVNSLMELKEFL
ncbi:MAG: YjjG family noncanonical pyrimidine nucleotidase [Chitinophagales bacterium]